MDLFFTTRQTIDGGASSSTVKTASINESLSVVKGGPVSSWRKKVSRNISASTTLEVNRLKVTEYEPGIGAVWQRDTNPPPLHYNHLLYSGIKLFTFSTTPALPSLVDDTSLNNAFLKRCSESVHRFQGSTFVAELSSTIRGLRNPLAAIKELLRKAGRVKKSDFRTSRELLRATSGTWLEIAFGLKPLIGDIEDALEALDVMAIRQYTERVSISSGDVTSKSFQNSGGIFGTGVNCTALRTAEQGRSLIIYGVVKIENSYGARRFGFTPDCLVPALYEAVPGSFLLDYIIPLGEYIDALTFPSSSLAWCIRGRRSYSTVVITNTLSLGPGFTYSWALPVKHAVLRIEREVKRREPYLPQAVMPRVEFASSVPKLINSIALLVQHLTKR